VVLCIAFPAFAVSVTAVRVGAHPDFTRIVFELDGRAGYQVEQVGTDAAPELRITIDAMSSAHELRANGDVRGVKVDAGTKARAHIALRSSGLRVRETMLSDPPRIVIDLHKPETAVADATRPAPKASAKENPAPAPKVAEKEGAKPETPKTVAKEAPPPAPAPKVAEKEAAKPEAPKTVAKEPPPPAPPPKTAAPTPPPAPDSALIPSPRVAPPPPAPVAPPAVEPPKPAEPEHAAAPPAPAPIAPPAEPTPDSVAKLPPAPMPAPPAVSPPALVRPTPAPKAQPAAPPATGGSWVERLTSHPLWLGGAVVVLLSLAAIALVMRRRRALPNDLDVTAIAEEVEQTAELDAPGRVPSGGFAMGDDSAPSTSRPEEIPLSGLFDRPAAPAPTWPAPPPAANPTPAAAEAEDSLFDDAGEMPAEPDAREGDAPMNQEMDLPVDRRPSQPAARMGGSAAPSPDIARMLQDFERRIATLEARLDESNEAREKLERQVAAQSEELRVQRAAIARTQRALRTMTRGDEDKATEPALRDGDTQAKTRVTP
jgi:hypothetical protein